MDVERLVHRGAGGGGMGWGLRLGCRMGLGLGPTCGSKNLQISSKYPSSSRYNP